MPEKPQDIPKDPRRCPRAILERIYTAVEQFLPPGQSGFRRNRSTADVVWSYRWLQARVKLFNEELHICGIDMSKAFDSINRNKVLDTLKPLIDSSSHKLIRLLLSNTYLQVRIEGGYSNPVSTVAGTPQGDALSPIPFTIYLEAAMKRYRIRMSAQVPRGADDVDLIAQTVARILEADGILGEELGVDNLIVNPLL
jgi:hypothetical protein